MGSNQQYVNARYIVSVPRVGLEPISPGKIQGSTIELQRQTNRALLGFWASNPSSKFPQTADITDPVLMI